MNNPLDEEAQRTAKRLLLLLSPLIALALLWPLRAHGWTRHITATGSGGSSVNAIARDSAGNVIACGSIWGTTEFGTTQNGSSDAWIAKYSPTGVYLWHQYVRGASGDICHAVATDFMGNVYAAGQAQGAVDASGIPLPSTGAGNNAWVLAFNPGGGTIWARTYGASGNDYAKAIAVWGGRVHVVGSFNFTVSFGTTHLTSAGLDDVFLLALSAVDGSTVSARSIGGAQSDYATAIAADVNGVTVATDFRGTITVGGTTLTAASVGTLTGVDTAIVRYGSDGTQQWAIRAGGPGEDRAYALATGPDGEVYAAGQYSSQNFQGGMYTMGAATIGASAMPLCTQAGCVWVARVSAAGVPVWAYSRQTHYASVIPDVLYGLSVGATVTAVGSIVNAIDFGGGVLGGNTYDALRLELTRDGAYVAATRYVGTISERANGVSGDAIGGWFSKTLAIDEAVSTTASGGEGFVYVPGVSARTVTPTQSAVFTQPPVTATRTNTAAPTNTRTPCWQTVTPTRTPTVHSVPCDGGN